MKDLVEDDYQDGSGGEGVGEEDLQGMRHSLKDITAVRHCYLKVAG